MIHLQQVNRHKRKQIVQLVLESMEENHQITQITPYINRNSIMLIEDEKIIGCCLIRIEKPGSAEIMFICTDELKRKKGYGKTMVHNLQKRFSHIRLTVREDNWGAIALYTKTGFKNIQNIPKYYMNGKGANEMRWKLGRK